MNSKNSLRSTYITSEPNGWTFSDIPSNSLERFPNSSANVGIGLGANSNHISEASTIVKQLVAASLLQFGATSLSMPFEVGKVLLQVQYNPKEKVGIYAQNVEQEDEEDDEEDEDVSI